MRALVYGSGHWGKNWIRELSGHVVGVVEPDEKRAELARNTFNVKVYPDTPTDIDFDAAVIVTPPEFHVPLALPLLKAGKYVMIEKPAATSVEEALTLWSYRERCMVGYIYLHHPVIDDMLSWLMENPCDHAFARRTNSGPVRPWGNAMWDLASHDISIFNRLFGHCLGVEATGSRDWVMMRLDYVAVSANIYASWLGKPKCRKVELVPTWCPGCERDHENLCNNRFIFDDVSTVLEITPLRREVDAFLSGSWEHGTLEEAIDVLKVLEQAQQGIRM